MMRTKYYIALAYGTLVVDAYLALASVAAEVVPRQNHAYLPPFGWIGASAASRFAVLLIATWTAVLAIGCLRPSGEHLERSNFAASLWFLLVLAVIWILVVLRFIAGLV